MLKVHALSLPLIVGTVLTLRAQSPADQPPAQASNYTLTVNSRLVVEDVVVTDDHGRPVKNLPQVDFHVYDEGTPQKLKDFHEQVITSAVPASSKQAESDTNASLLRNQGTLVSILIDPMTIDLKDQMYLSQQALKFVDAAPPSVRIAVFRANNQGVPVLLQSPTADHALLRTAINESVPVLVRPVYSQFENAIAELGNIADFLRAVPGNKAVIWLAGKFPLYEPPDFTQATNNDESRLQDERRSAFRALEQARIALYPVDVRGVLQGGMLPIQVIDKDAWANDPSLTPKGNLSESAKVTGQYETMDLIADATGGRAFYSNNSIATVMSDAVELATSSYSLTYQPTNYRPDNSWHKVKVVVDGPYTVHFRTGYYADPPADGTQGTKIVLRADGSKNAAPSPGSPSALQTLAGSPLMFSAHVVAGPKEGKSSQIKVRYVIPADQLHFNDAGSTSNARFKVAVIAYNAWGDVLSQAMDIVETHYSPQQMQLANRIGAPADQTASVAKGAQFLLLSVQDLNTQKVGTLQLPLAQVQTAAVSTGK